MSLAEEGPGELGCVESVISGSRHIPEGAELPWASSQQELSPPDPAMERGKLSREDFLDVEQIVL